MRWYFRIPLLTSFFVLLWFPGVHGSHPTMPTIDVEMSLTFSPEPELGEEFTVTLTFTPREEIPHANELDDAAEISLDPGVEVVSGVPWWEGKWVKGKTETFQVVVKVTEPGYYTFFGMVYSCRSDPRLWRKLLGIRPEMAEISEKIFRFHNDIRHNLCIGKPELQTGKEIWSIDASTGEAKRIRVDEPPVPPSLLPEKAIVRGTEAPWNGMNAEGETQEKTTTREYGFPIRETSQTSGTVRIYYVGHLGLSEGDSLTVFLFDQDVEKVVKAAWHCEPESSCKIETLPDHKVRITSSWEEGDYLIVGAFEGIQHVIRVTVTGSH